MRSRKIFCLHYYGVSRVTFRLLMDAQFLHQKLSALKNVGAPTTMLETVISEKSVASKEPPPPPVQSPVPPPVQTQAQRFKGMLGRANSLNFKSPMFSANLEKALPALSAAALPPPPTIVTPTPPAVEASPSPALELSTPSVDPMADDLTPSKTAAPPSNATPEPEVPQLNGVPNGDIAVRDSLEAEAESTTKQEAETAPPVTPPKSDDVVPVVTESTPPADKLEHTEPDLPSLSNGTTP